MKKKAMVFLIIGIAAILASGCASSKGGLKEKNKDLRAQLRETAEAQKKDKAAMYMELGNAYTKAKDFKSAIDSYEASLALNADNAEAHYNLGLLYMRYQENTKKALQHFGKFLKLNHSPKDEREVKYLIRMLRSGRDWNSLY